MNESKTSVIDSFALVKEPVDCKQVNWLALVIESMASVIDGLALASESKARVKETGHSTSANIGQMWGTRRLQSSIGQFRACILNLLGLANIDKFDNISTRHWPPPESNRRPDWAARPSRRTAAVDNKGTDELERIGVMPIQQKKGSPRRAFLESGGGEKLFTPYYQNTKSRQK